MARLSDTSWRALDWFRTRQIKIKPASVAQLSQRVSRRRRPVPE